MRSGVIRQFLLPLTAIAVFSLLSFSGISDSAAERAVESALKRALVTFAAVRGLNAVISAAQGTEVSVTPFGMGVTLAPGEVLDPVNDLVERFSGFMLVSSVALGIQRVFLEISSWAPYSVFLVALASMLVLCRVSPKLAKARWSNFLWRIVCVLAVVRFMVPVAVIGSEWMYTSFLENHHVEAEKGIVEASDRVRSINYERGIEVPSTSRDGSLQRFKDWAENAKDKALSAIQLSRYTDALKETAKDAIELIVVFFLSTILFPVIIVLLLWQLTRWAFAQVVEKNGPE